MFAYTSSGSPANGSKIYCHSFNESQGLKVPECQLVFYRFTWGPPDLARALQSRDPRFVTRAPRRSYQHGDVDLQAVSRLRSSSATCLTLRAPRCNGKYCVTWYELKTPIMATVTVTRSNAEGVVPRYDLRKPLQGARLFVDRRHVEQDKLFTKTVMVIELQIAKKRCPLDLPVFKTVQAAAVPVSLYKNFISGEIMPSLDVVADINYAVSCDRGSPAYLGHLWRCLEGKEPVCAYIV